MRIVEIEALDNGAHRNQNGGISTVPEGWAIIPDGMAIPATFPFVDIEVEDQTVISMTAGIVPEAEPVPVPQPTAQDDTDAMMVDHEYRLTLLELGMTE